MSDIKDLPKGWTWTKVSDVATLIRGINYKKEVASNYPTKNKLPILRANNINGELNYEDLVYVPKELIKPEQIIKKDDIIFAMSSGSRHLVGKTAVSKKDFEGSYGAFCSLLRVSDDVNKTFISFIFKSNAYRKLISEIAKGTNINNLKREHILDFRFPLPPLETQQAIVSKIEELFSEVDKGIEDLKLAQKQFKVYRQSVLKYAYEGRLTNENVKEGVLPEGWEFVKLKEIGTWKGGGTPSKQKKEFWENGTIPWVSPKDMKSKLIIKTIDSITESAILKSSAKLITKGSVLFVVRSGILRRTLPVAINSIDVAVNQDIQAFTPSEVSPEYVYWYIILNNEMIRKDCSKAGTTVESIESILLKNYAIPVCSIEEQNAIVLEIENRLSVADKIEEDINDSIQKAKALRQSILKKAFKGELIAEVKPVEVPKIKNEYFNQLQLVALVINSSRKKKIDHGEMTLAKNLYLLDAIYNIPTGFKYDRWHLGPYPPALKKVVNNKEYFNRTDNYIEVQNKEKLLKYNNPLQDQITTAIDDLSSIFSKYKGAERSHKTELLATVCKVIEDIKTTDLAAVRESMQEWKIELKNSKFKNKAEKFSEVETQKCIEFIVERGWDRKLIKISK